MNDYERKYFHLRMLINEIRLNCYKINLLTAEAVRIKDKLDQIEILSLFKDASQRDLNNDTELKIKEAIEREFLF